MLHRVLEPEVMDSQDDAAEYDAIDHSVVNREFVLQALAVCPEPRRALDLGTGPAQIPIQLALMHPSVEVTAVDVAEQMLTVAQANVKRAGLSSRIRLHHRDVKATGFEPNQFDLILCNSVVHHLQDPVPMLTEIARLAGHSGRFLIKDLLRPTSLSELLSLVERYADKDTPYQRKLFADSLHAALTIQEAELACDTAGLGPIVVQQTSDRHYCITRRVA
jgi:ubiquinone/menaquinone biosynthesis C-methylase UbiE